MAHQQVTNIAPHFAKWIGIYIIQILFIFGFVSAHAAIPPVYKNALSRPGSVTGGQAGTGFSILNLELVPQKNKVERIIVDVGNFEGKPHKGKPGYFHVEMKANRLVSIDFAQMGMTKVTQEKLNLALKKSRLVSKGRITYDSQDQNMNVSLTPRKAFKVKAYQVMGKNQTSK
ncbi:MAG: hypothetical protein ACK5WZ_11845, partial [Pseudobdellovibrionaceae bacterium]